MKFILCCLVMIVVLAGCSGKTDQQIKTEADLNVQADLAKAKLQEKADALARSAAMSGEAKPAK